MEIKKYKKVSSTNVLAKKAPNKPWLIVLAEEQTAGYGRKKDYWFSPKGGLYFSIILPKSNIEDLQTLTLLAAFAIAETIKENLRIKPFIKLPNDVYINNKKVAGILTENVVGKDVKFSVMGIGLNTNISKFPKKLEGSATSLQLESKKKINNKKILVEIVKKIKKQLEIISV